MNKSDQSRIAKKRAAAVPDYRTKQDRSRPNAVSKPFPFPDAAFCASLFGLVFLAYFPALQGAFLWDDRGHITRPELRSLHGLWRIWSDLSATQQYYPLLHTAFWVEHRLWGDAVLGYHLTNIALHAASACLVMLIVRNLSLPGARLAALVFALHPVCVEAVAWISEQKSTLSAFFYLGSALAYLRFDTARRRSLYAFATLLFILAVLTKTVTATLPAALLVVLWWKRGRLDWRRDVLPLTPWLAFGAASGIFTAWVEWRFIGARGADFDLTFLERLLLAGRALCFYAAKLVWPANLIFTYPRWVIDQRIWWQYLFSAAVLAAGIGFLFMARRYRGPLAGFLFFAGTLFPVLGFLNVYPFRFSYVADHFAYLASLGIIVPSIAGLTPRLSSTKFVGVFPPALIAILGFLTWQQSATYRDDETLYRRTLARNPQDWMGHHNLGQALAETPGRLPEAIEEYQASLRIYPGFAETHSNLGNALSTIPGRMPDAIREFETAMQINPDYATAHYNLANVLAQMPERLPEAIAQYREALRTRPDFAEAHHNLGNALAQTPGRLSEAIVEYQAALRLNPDLAEAHNDLGRALSQMPDRLFDGLAQCKTAIRLKPDFAAAHNNMGIILSQMPGRTAEAIVAYEGALRIQPDYAEAHNNLGSALAQSGRLPEAIAEFEAALRINPRYAEAQSNLEYARDLAARSATPRR